MQPDHANTETLDFRTSTPITTSKGDAADKTDDITGTTDDVTDTSEDVTDTTDDVTDKTDDLTGSKVKTIDLLWLIKRMCIIASREAAKSSGPTLKRTCVVKWLAAVAMELGKDRIGPYLLIMMRPIGREANDKMTQAGEFGYDSSEDHLILYYAPHVHSDSCACLTSEMSVA